MNISGSAEDSGVGRVLRALDLEGMSDADRRLERLNADEDFALEDEDEL